MIAEEPTIYILIFIISLVVIAVNVYASGIERNIVHLENGREPNAGVSLMGYIVFPIFFIGVAYLGNMMSQGLGWYLVFGLFTLSALRTVIMLPRQVKKYNELLKQRSGS